MMPSHLTAKMLLATTAVFAIATAANAEEVKTKLTAPIRTSTIKSGAPDTITLTKDGSVIITSGIAVTQDSNHTVVNAGTITVTNGDGTVGIHSTSGAGDISNTGTITVDEVYTPIDSDKDGDLDGPFALGSNRTGIKIHSDHTGQFTQSGTVTVKGNDSVGVVLNGKLNGAFAHDGSTSVLGDRGIGVFTQGIDGNVRLAGSVSSQGKDAMGALFAGDINGAIVVQGNISATGYRYAQAPSDPSKLDADDLQQGASALVIEGNVSGGIILAAAPKADASKPDSDSDGIDDNKEGSAKVVSYGSAAAMQIGATNHAITIGPVANTTNTFGLILEGAIEGNGVYNGIVGNGLVIGGRGGAVTIVNGVGISGTITANAIGASATALRIGANAATPQLQNTGTISANTADTENAQASALKIDAGGNLPIIRNSGVIKAVSGEKGAATAISDASGTLNLIENAGTISASGAKDSTHAIAIDLTASTGNLTVKQTQVANGITAPAIIGDVRLAGGNDVLDLADGTLTGNVAFGTGNNTLKLSGDALQIGDVSFGGGNDTISLAGSSSYGGAIDFGGGADTLTLAGNAHFKGSIANASQLAVKVSGGTLDLNKSASIASLDVSTTGTLVVTLDKRAGEGSAYSVAGDATFADGAKLAIRLADVSTAEGSYQVLTANRLSGDDKLTTNTDLVPFMFKAELDKDAAANTIVVDVSRRTVSELGLNRSGAAAYNAVFTQIGMDEKVEQVFLGISNGDAFREAIGQMLPDHAGGAFEGISLGSRALARQMQDPQGPFTASGRFSTTFNMALWGSDRKTGNTAAYKLHGSAWSATGEYRTGIGLFGASIAYINNAHKNGAFSEVKSKGFEFATHWRGKFGPVAAFARGSAGTVGFDGERNFYGAIGTENVQRTMHANWGGKFVTAAGGASIEGGSQFFFFRPGITVDYVRLKEDGYTETGAEKLNLSVAARTSDELALNPSITVGVDFLGMRARDVDWFRMETETGWRQVVKGGIGSTTAHFDDGNDFTLNGDSATSGWFARLRAIGGYAGFSMGGELSAEDRHGRVDLALRGSITIGW